MRKFSHVFSELQTIKNNAAAQARARVSLSLSVPFNYFVAKAAIISQLKRDYNDSQIYLLFKSRVLLYQFSENISLKILPALKRYYLVFFMRCYDTCIKVMRKKNARTNQVPLLCTKEKCKK